ncbi:MAG: hypothetical protein WA152_00130 [Microgenomates group bacterium]
MAKIIQTSDPKYIRLTKREMVQLRKLKVGQIFYHINLDHSNTNQYPDFTKFKAVEIIKIGTVTKTKIVNPTVDLNNGVAVELLETITNIKVSDLTNQNNLNLFLYDNNKGLLESLVDRYSKVLNSNKNAILKMNCYIRKFKINYV